MSARRKNRKTRKTPKSGGENSKPAENVDPIVDSRDSFSFIRMVGPADNAVVQAENSTVGPGVSLVHSDSLGRLDARNIGPDSRGPGYGRIGRISINPDNPERFHQGAAAGPASDPVHYPVSDPAVPPRTRRKATAFFPNVPWHKDG